MITDAQKQALLDVIEDEMIRLQSMVANGNFSQYTARQALTRLGVAVDEYSLELRVAAVAAEGPQS